MPLSSALTAPPQVASQDTAMRKLLRQIGQGTASGAAVVGNTLNKPSRALWGSLNYLTGGDSGGGLLNMIPFSDTMGLTDPNTGIEASKFLANQGVISQNDPNQWEWMDPVRGAIDVAGDPLSWAAPLGLTKTGLAASRAGKLTPGIVPSIAKGERAILGLQVPFGTKNFASLGTGPAAAGGLGKVSSAVGKSAIGRQVGKVAEPAARWWKQAFDAKAMGARTAAGQAGGEMATRLSDEYTKQADNILVPHARELHQGGTGSTADAISQRSYGEFGKAGRPLASHEAAAVADVQWILGTLRGKAKAAGIKVGETLDDVIDYLPRHLSGQIPKSRRRSMWSALDREDSARLHVLKGFSEGTEGVNKLFRDADVDRLVSAAKATPAWATDAKFRKSVINTVEGMLSTKYGSTVEGVYQIPARNKAGRIKTMIDPATGKKVPVMKDVSRFRQLAKKTISNDDWRKNGVFNNHWLVDAQTKAHSLAHRTALAEAAVDTLAKNAMRSPDGVKVRDIVRQIGLDSKTVVNHVLSARGLSLSGLGTKRAARVAKQIMDETIDPDLADDLTKAWPAFRTPPELHDIQKGWKNFTALWKAGQLTWPARYVRDMISGGARLFEQGALDAGSWKQAHNTIQGRAVPGLADIPAVVDHLRTRGLLPPTGAVSDEVATNALRDLYGVHFTQPGGMLTDTLHTGSTANARPLSEITDRVPGLDYVSELESAKQIGRQATFRDPLTGSFDAGSTNPLNVRGFGENTRSKFGPVAAGDRIGTYTDSVSRMAGFINRLKSGADPAAAAKEINTMLVDYAPKNFTPTERALKAVMPFYSFTSRQIPYLTKELMMNPAGRTSQLVRATARSQSNDQFLPEHVAQTTAIPLGQKDDGTKSFLTGLGLMHEDPLGFLGGGVQGALTEGLSRSHPFIKGPIEWATGESLFQRGPMGGRDLGDMDPTIGRLLSNLGETAGLREPGGGPVRYPGQMPVEFLLGNSPISRGLTTARSALDPRKSAMQKALNTLTGARVSDVSPASQDAVLRDAATKLGKEIGAKEFSSIRFRKADLEQMAQVSPEAAEMAQAFNELQNQLASRVKGRKNSSVASAPKRKKKRPPKPTGVN